MAQSQTAKKNKDKGKATKSKAPQEKKKKERKLKPVEKTESKKEEPKEEKLTATTDCKVFGSPDVNHKKCQDCKDLDECLKLEAQTKKAKSKSKPKAEPRGTDFIGFLSGSKKSLFALTIAKKPRHMKEIKEMPWNEPTVQTFYDTFNQLRRNVKDDKPHPLAEKNKKGQMFIVRKNLSKAQKEQMQKEIEAIDF